MNELQKYEKELTDSIKLNNSSFVQIIQNQEKLQENIESLQKQLNDMGSILDSLKEPNYASFSKDTLQNSPFTEVYKMSFFQILKHKSLFNNRNSLRSSMIEQSNPLESIIVEKEESGIQSDEINEFTMQKDLISQIQNDLLDQNIEEAYSKYQILKEFLKTETNFDIFMKSKVLQKILIEEIMKITKSIPIGQYLDYQNLEKYIDILIQEEKSTMAVSLYLNRASDFIKKIDLTMSIPDITERFFQIILQIQKNIEEKFNDLFQWREHIILLQNWFIEQTEELLESSPFQDDYIEDRIDALQEFNIYSAEFEIKGFSIDFLVKRQIRKLQGFLKEDNNQIFINQS